MIKQKEILKTETDKDGMTHTTLTRVPGEGFIFGLYNSDPIAYRFKRKNHSGHGLSRLYRGKFGAAPAEGNVRRHSDFLGQYERLL